MASLVLTGDTSGTITVSAPAVAGSNTLTLQAATATNSVNTLATAVASTSGTSIDFTGLPAWVKRITVMYQGISTNGSSNYQVQIGSGSFVTSGYLGTNSTVASASASTLNISAGFIIFTGGNPAAISHGMTVLTSLGSNVWLANGTLGRSDGNVSYIAAGSLALGGTLDRVRITTVNGTDTFDAGSVNILYEG
jgi:hypothetical protein